MKGKIHKKNRGRKRREGRRKKIGEKEERRGRKKKENDRFSISGFEWSLSFEGDFLKF